jgi:DNA-binding response OmpR family regulator
VNKPTIAVIDDHSDTRTMLEDFLKNLYDVSPYGNAREAFEGMKKNPPQAALTDILLTDNDGMELLRWMRADPVLKRVPLVAMSGLPFTETIKKVGFDQYLLKPVDMDRLLAVLHACLAGHPIHEQNRRTIPGVPSS